MSDAENITLQPLKIKKSKTTAKPKPSGSPIDKVKVPKKAKSPTQKSPNPQQVLDALKKDYDDHKCMIPTNLYSEQCNKFLLKRELLERAQIEEHPNEDSYLYPTLNDPNFNIKIAEKKEFNDTQYDGKIYDGKMYDIEKHATELNNAEFELAPHQAFVRNFMSFQTPYNSLLLFHALGSGKTLSAIGVCEEMRSYLKQMGISKRILIVASPNVQDNFRLQLFDERKLKLVDGLWTMRDTIGTQLLKEINPMNMKGFTKEKIITLIKALINSMYLFLGYVEFANYVERTQRVNGEFKSEKDKKIRMARNLQMEFDNRLIVIDEVHNIRIGEDNDNKKVAEKLLELVSSANNLRLLLLSATPMYNTYQEIIWLINLMNINDRRGTIDIKDVFDKEGNWRKNAKGEEIGKELLIQKATGYISYVRGENPYTFPFRVYPDVFAPDNTFKKGEFRYPAYQMNGRPIVAEDQLKILNLYLTKIGDYQSKGYQYVIDSLRRKKITTTTKTGEVKEMPSFENMEAFGYTLLQIPIEALNIVYPIDGLDEAVEDIIPIDTFLTHNPKKSASKPSEKAKTQKVAKPRAKKDASVNAATKSNKKAKLKLVVPQEVQNIENVEELPQTQTPPPPPPPPLETEVVELTKKPSSEPSIESYVMQPTVKGGADTPSSESNTMRINAHDLTGKHGLERMMDFIDRKSPPEKGSFEYKPLVLRKWGRIFSPSEIGKYSCKIKNICDNILSPTGTVNEGVILIYAQYIDGGVLPIALALEEMGFIRYGDGAKSLFKTPPTPPVDVRTMKPRTDPKADFIPARYSLITGDVRLSPNNAYEVKGATNLDNKDGYKVKVVIISQAGAEGLDFKFLRQIHILQPWYNMSRIEQIIGRGVRNFGHKDLPFEKRNVEIFMYGTILDNNKEEAADLYIYRLAEYKAIQIGRVSRLLKETAVDCIINHDQTNFTQDIMTAYSQGTVKQILSNGEKIPKFKVGDAPFSSACDYMEECAYKCYPNKEKKKLNLNEDTYTENFIMLNSDKIIKKIRTLMKEKYFYKKKDLIMLINTQVEYPIVQIYAALTELIENSNEYIVDKYGRTGYLVNIGEYYIFQPSELNNNHVSIFDRSVPIDFKHNMIKFNVKDIIEPTREVIDKRNVEDAEYAEIIRDQKEDKEIELVKTMKLKYNTAMEYVDTNKKIDKSTEKDEISWYKYCGVSMRKLMSEGVSKQDVTLFLVEHLVDMLLYKEKVELLNYLYSLEVIDEGSFDEQMKNYLDTQIIHAKGGLVGIILYTHDTRKIMILNKQTHRWVDAEAEDVIDIAKVAATKYAIAGGKQFNTLIGFIGNEKSNKYLVFKTLQTDAKRNTGARCDEAVKAKKIKILNMVVGEEDKYTKENTKGMVESELCSLQEFILRYYNKISKNNKIWFLNYEMARIYNF